MSATMEVQKPTAVDAPPAAVKHVKEKKSKAAPKEKKPRATTKTTAAHPPYFEMIKEAIQALKERGGSSPYAIAKYMEEKHKGVLPANFRKTMSLQLKNSAAKGKLVKVKASYKLSDSDKKEKKPTTAKKTATNTAPKKAAAATKPGTTKAPKKAAAAKKPGTTKAPKKTAAVGTKRKASEAVRKVAAPKKGVKKAATPVKPKQPKSIKSPGAKKAKKTVV